MDFADSTLDVTRPTVRYEPWLPRYAKRVGIDSMPGKSKIELGELTLAHIRTFPFDMLDYFLGAVPTINVTKICEKFLVESRGGGCSQHNTLFAEVLRQYGFECHFGLASVPKEDGTFGPRSHMILFVHWNNTDWLCDVGYGLYGPVYPISLDTRKSQPQGCHEFRVVKLNQQDFALETQTRGFWRRLYVFDKLTYSLEHFEPINYQNTLSEDSTFTKNLVVSMPTLTGGHMIRNKQFVSIGQGFYQKEKITSLDQLVALLQRKFSIDVKAQAFLTSPFSS